jgi:hypothetical protein
LVSAESIDGSEHTNNVVCGKSVNKSTLVLPVVIGQGIHEKPPKADFVRIKWIDMHHAHDFVQAKYGLKTTTWSLVQ